MSLTVQHCLQTDASPHDWMEGELLSGRFAPGSVLDLDAIALKLGVSVRDLREAVVMLSSDGLVILDANGGLRAAPVSLADLHDLTATRIAIEGEALRASLAAGDQAWEEILRASFADLADAEHAFAGDPAGHMDHWEHCNAAFHAALVAACPLRRLLKFNVLLYKQHERYRRLSLARRPASRNVQAEHEALYQAALARDGAEATRVLASHIDRTATLLSNGIRDGRWFGAALAVVGEGSL
jgi:DNA-binding GntR family transcriptional regulator